MVNIQVAYASVKKQTITDLEVSENTSVQAAIAQSKIVQQFPEIDLSKNKVGIYGEIVALDTQVSQGDRIEIYRPLNVDPIEARRLRAKKSKDCK